jgi:gliding motility associated protien GldN
MKNRIFALVVVSFCRVASYAQQAPPQPNVLDGIYVKEHFLERKAMGYPYLREADVMWSKRIWRIIDLKQKLNLPLAWPASGTITNRKSLVDVLFDALKEGSITAYSDEEWVLPTTMKDIEATGGARVDTQKLTRATPPYEEYDTVIAKNFNRDKVILFRVKEDWFFDKQRSVMDVRIIGIAPVVYAEDETGNIREGNFQKVLCWFYYPELRNLLANKEVFNRQNDAERRTFEDIFQKRMFSSLIYKEANVYDRKIDEYKTGINQVLESDRVKQDIMNLEHDMWEY